ncbi:MAG: LrgB family protein [Casimicrobiaceae bacterium]
MTDDLFRLWVYLAATPLLGLTLTFVAYQLGLWLAHLAGGHPLVNPVLIAMVAIGSLLAATGTPYRQYFEGAQFVHFLLGTATVALAVPFFDRLAALRKRALALSAGLVAGSVITLGLVVLLMGGLGARETTLLSMVPKSVTAPIAMGISEAIGGIPTLSAVFCVTTGVIGAATGKLVFDAIGVRDLAIRGFALGVQAHGIGTARAFYVSPEAGAYAGLALGLNGIVSALLLPVLTSLLR